MALIKRFKIKSFKKNNKIVELKNISKSFGNRQVLNNISFNVGKGEILGILGPNGAGKSTMLKILNGILVPNFGNVFINNVDCTDLPIYERANKYRLGYLPQRGGAMFDLTLYENLLMVAEIHIKEKELRQTKLENIISQFNFESISKIKAKNLSGGQFKRCVIAMALINDPQVLMLDEPFAALDILTIKMLQEVIVNLQTLRGISTVVVDHLARDLLQVTDRNLILSSEGNIVAEGSSEEIVNHKLAKEVYFGHEFKLK